MKLSKRFVLWAAVAFTGLERQLKDIIKVRVGFGPSYFGSCRLHEDAP